MVGYGFLYAASCHHCFQLLAHRPVVHLAKHQLVFLQVLVAADNLQGDVHQLHLEGDIRLVTLADNPLVAVDVHDVVRRQVLHVDERKGGEANKDEDVTNEGKIVILELMGYDSLQFFLSQELSFLAVRADVELRERVTGNLSVVVRPQHDTFQPHTPLPDSSVSQSSVYTEIGCEVLDELKIDYPDAEIMGHCELEGVHKDCPSFSCQEYRDYFDKLAN